MRAADWAVRVGEGDVLLQLGCAIYPFFNTYSLGEPLEGRRWLEAGLAAQDGPDIALRTWPLGFASTLATVDGDHDHEGSLAEEGLALARSHGYRRGEAQALDSLGFSAMVRGDLAGRGHVFERARHLAAARSERFGKGIFDAQRLFRRPSRRRLRLGGAHARLAGSYRAGAGRSRAGGCPD
jgi:hypothetical protein